MSDHVYRVANAAGQRTTIRVKRTGGSCLVSIVPDDKSIEGEVTHFELAPDADLERVMQAWFVRDGFRVVE